MQVDDKMGRPGGQPTQAVKTVGTQQLMYNGGCCVIKLTAVVVDAISSGILSINALLTALWYCHEQT